MPRSKLASKFLDEQDHNLTLNVVSERCVSLEEQEWLRKLVPVENTTKTFPSRISASLLRILW